MGYIDENLMNGERIIHRTKLHWIVLLWPIIMALLGFIFIAVGFALREYPVFVGIGFVLVVSAIICQISFFITYKTSEFGITNKRILIKVGFINRTSLETLLTKVEGIQVNQGILGRIFNYGSIIVKGTGGTSNPFHDIVAPMEFRKKVQEQISLVQ